MQKHQVRFNSANYQAVIFDLDGVVTQTARLHAHCWKQVFDQFLQQRQTQTGERLPAFDLKKDYQEYVDGKPRYDGVQSFLQSRDIKLPFGDPDDPPDSDTVCGLGNRKTELFEEALHREGAEVYQGTVAWIGQLRSQGLKTAVVSASKHCQMILQTTSLTRLFDARVDGSTAEALHLRGKPEPDTYLKAAQLLQVEPRQAVVVEDALAGVQAGHRGGFGLVIGVDRKGDAQELMENGADFVVEDLVELVAENFDDNR
jgi:beta-phosphoglucomutase family hydrolase